MRRDTIIAAFLSLGLLTLIANLDKIFPEKAKPEETKKVTREVTLMELPPIEPLEPEVDEELEEETEIDDLPSIVPPLNPDIPSVDVSHSDFQQQLQPPPPQNMGNATEVSVIPPNVGVEGAQERMKDLFNLIDLDSRPSPTYQPSPQYPFEARREGKSGSVLLGFIIRSDGTTSHIRVVRSSDHVFDEEAIRAIEKWKFRPGRKDGRPVNVNVQQELTFDIDDVE